MASRAANFDDVGLKGMLPAAQDGSHEKAEIDYG
jgi:hypothetical protein